jgi:hypothetical protein
MLEIVLRRKALLYERPRLESEFSWKKKKKKKTKAFLLESPDAGGNYYDWRRSNQSVTETIRTLESQPLYLFPC